MIRATIMTLSLIFYVASVCVGQAPEITFASSSYKTTSGAIGPKGIVATTTYEVKLASKTTIILDHVILDNLIIHGDGILIPTTKEGILSFRIIVARQQKDSVMYLGFLEHESIRIPARVSQINKTTEPDDLPAIVLSLRSNRTAYMVSRLKFDQKQAQYNK